tara:strand:- start:266 stop:460 length:195 start_codon:yes stop_codon:yes gene_type:complete
MKCTLTLEDVEQSMFGSYVVMYCHECGDQEEKAIESDAWGYKCPSCDAMAWGSAEEYLMRGYVG